MKTKFKVSHAEMTIYKGAFRNGYYVTLPGVEGKNILSDLKVKTLGDDEFELIAEYGKVVKREISK